ncbi:MAG TPA: TIM barrel protein [Phycisphaerae bacterium]|nr:TIM barrel protein [Phycisphaerae bacterium]
MRLGGPVFGKDYDPDSWAAEAKSLGWRAAFCPVPPGAPEDEVRAYAEAAAKADLVIAEVGAWSNPLSADEAERKAALDKCIGALATAERIGARCAVNIAGSRGAKWDGPAAGDLTDETFEMVVECIRRIIDAVKPTRTFYTLETMPWMYPDSPDSYLRLIEAIDRPAFAVHLDPVNLVCSPQRYYANADLIRECFAKLGPHIKSCHAKDIVLRDKLTTHLDECRPGAGGLDYRVYLRELSKLDADVPLMIEHLPGREDCLAAAEHIRNVARDEGINV